IGAQPLETGLDGSQDVDARQTLIVGTIPDLDAALGRQDEAITLAVQPFAEDDLRAPGRLRGGRHWIDVGSVDEVDTALDGPVENAEAGALITLMTERHGAQADFRDVQAGSAELPQFHG